MSKLFELIQALFPGRMPRLDGDEAYLAESTDIAELERRMREIDRRGRSCSLDLVFAVGLR
jgi:hypothetical protein